MEKKSLYGIDSTKWRFVNEASIVFNVRDVLNDDCSNSMLIHTGRLIQ